MNCESQLKQADVGEDVGATQAFCVMLGSTLLTIWRRSRGLLPVLMLAAPCRTDSHVFRKTRAVLLNLIFWLERATPRPGVSA